MKPPYFHFRKDGDFYDYRRNTYDYKPFKFNRRVDAISSFAEAMYKLGSSRPQVRKDVK